MAKTQSTLRKLNIHERRALRFVRLGAQLDIEAEMHGYGAAFAASHADWQARFCELHNLAIHHGMAISPIDASITTADEQFLLRWLAESQRQAGLRSCEIEDAKLHNILLNCAVILLKLGISLPSQTLYRPMNIDGKKMLSFLRPAQSHMRQQNWRQQLSARRLQGLINSGGYQPDIA